MRLFSADSSISRILSLQPQLLPIQACSNGSTIHIIWHSYNMNFTCHSSGALCRRSNRQLSVWKPNSSVQANFFCLIPFRIWAGLAFLSCHIILYHTKILLNLLNQQYWWQSRISGLLIAAPWFVKCLSSKMPKIDVENQNAFIEAAKWERLLGVQSSNSKAVCSTSRRSWSTARNPDSSSLGIDCEQAFLESSAWLNLAISLRSSS